MPTYDVRGVPVEFPYDAYECQLAYMAFRVFLPTIEHVKIVFLIVYMYILCIYMPRPFNS